MKSNKKYKGNRAITTTSPLLPNLVVLLATMTSTTTALLAIEEINVHNRLNNEKEKTTKK
jgi:hypothetical protein